MASPPQNDSILIVEPDPDLVAIFTAHFSAAADFKFRDVATGNAALEAIFKYRPQLVVIETQLPDRSGLSVLRELQTYPRTAHIPLIFLVGGTEVVLRNQILAAGAYDVVEKPVDVAELGLRIRNALRRTHFEGLSHPITHLPTGKTVGDAIDKMTQQNSYYLLDLNIAGFDTFKDLYGFVAANEVVTLMGNIVGEVMADFGRPEDFVGHRADADFVIITQASRGSQIYYEIQSRLDSQLPQFYSFIERDQGYVEVMDEFGQIVHRPLMLLKADISTR